MPSILPTAITENPNFSEVVNYHLHFDNNFHELAKKFVVMLIEGNNQLSKPELKKLIEKNSTLFLLSIKHILDELF